MQQKMGGWGMSSEWPLVKLGNLVEIKHGFAFKGEFFSDVATPFQLTTPGNFAIGGGFQTGKGKFYNGPVPEDYVLKAGDLLVTMTDLSKAGDTLGYAAVVPQTLGVTWLHNQRVGLVSTKTKASVSKGFLHYLMRSPEYRHWVVSTATGSTVKHTSPGRICDFEFPLPPIEHQHEVAVTLGALDDRITLLRETNATLEAIAQALFKSWFVDFDPVRAKMEDRAPEGMDEATAALFPDSFEETELDLVPRGWRVIALDEIANYLNGLALQKFPATGQDDLPVIKIAQLRKGDSVGADMASRNIKPEYIIQNGDVLFSWSGSLEVAIWCGGEGALNQHLFKVTSTNYPKWLYYLWTRHHLEHFRQVAASKATTMGHIQRAHLSGAKVFVPPKEVLLAANTVLQPIIERLIETALQAQTLSTLRDTLLPRLISGTLRLPEAHAELEAV